MSSSLAGRASTLIEERPCGRNEHDLGHFPVPDHDALDKQGHELPDLLRRRPLEVLRHRHGDRSELPPPNPDLMGVMERGGLPPHIVELMGIAIRSASPSAPDIDKEG